MIEVFITPNVINTDADLKLFDLQDRACFLEGEKKLRFFKVYTTKNCQLECFANYSSKVCGCIPFDVIRAMDTPVCELLDYSCILKLDHDFKLEHSGNTTRSCNCLQQCNSISYDYEFIETRFTKLRVRKAFKFKSLLTILFCSGSKDAILKVMFKDPQFVPYRRFRQFTFIDFLSYVGGLLGLFAGISVLSFFEIFYFFIPRFFTDIFKKFNKVQTN